jgi:hypothetical protein
VNPVYVTSGVPVEPLEPLVTAAPALLAAALFACSLIALRHRLRLAPWAAAIALLAALVRLVVIPVSRHIFDGHEAEYLSIYRGELELSQGGTMLYPAMQWLYAAAGQIMSSDWGLLSLSMVASIVSVIIFSVTVTSVTNKRVGVAVGVTLSLWATHAFHASSAYNIALPNMFIVLGLYAIVSAISTDVSGASRVRRLEVVWLGLFAGAAAALAVSTRLESLFAAPFAILLIAFARAKNFRLWGPGVFVGALLGVWAILMVMHGGETPGAESRGLSFANNVGNFSYWAPFDSVLGVVLVGCGYLLGLSRWPKLFVSLLITTVVVHLAFSSFDDYGSRHVALFSWLAVLPVSVLIVDKRTWILSAAVVALLIVHLSTVSGLYYQSEEAFENSISPELPLMSQEEVLRCSLICEDGRVVPESEQRSHFNLLDPVEAQLIREEKGCIYWLRGLEDVRWSSRAVRDRATRLNYLYHMSDIAVYRQVDGYVGVVVEVGERRGQ